MNAAFCCASLGIVPTVRHADYIGSWLDVLREDSRAIVRAASQASKAADYLLGFLPDAAPAAIERGAWTEGEVALGGPKQGPTKACGGHVLPSSVLRMGSA